MHLKYVTKIPAVESIKFSNGCIAQQVLRSESNVFTVHIRIDAGSNYENGDQIGAAHLCEHLITSGAKLSEGIEAIENVGGKFIAVTNRDSILFMIKVLDVYSSAALRIMPYFFDTPNGKNFRNHKKRALNELARIFSDRDRLLRRIENACLLKDSRGGQLNVGTRRCIENLKFKDVLKFHRQHFSLARTCVTVVSSRTDILERLKKILDNSPKKSLRGKTGNPKVVFKKSNVRINSNGLEPLSPTSIVLKAYKINSKGRVAALIFSQILRNACGGRVESINNTSNAHFGLIKILLKRKNLNIVKKMITNVQFTNKDIIKSKKQVIAQFVLENEKNSALGDWYSEMALYSKSQNANLYQKELEKIEAVTLDDVRIIKTEILKTGFGTITIGNKKLR